MFLAFSGIFQESAIAQILFPGGVYTQNFGSLSSTSTVAWSNNSTITGWYSTSSTLTISDGSSNVGGLVNYGAASSSDRALGGDGGTTFGLRLTNETGITVTSFTLSYTGEQWRAGATVVSSNQTLAFAYSLDATSLSTGTYTNVASLNFSSITDNGGITGTALDGNNSANRLAILATVTGISWVDGSDLWLRWDDPDDLAIQDHGLAVDDLQFEAVPEPGILPLLAGGALLLFWLRRNGGSAAGKS